MMEKLRIAILGCGLVADLHAKAIRADERLTLCGVWNRTYSKAEEFARKNGTAAYRTIEEIRNIAKADACVVATTHPTHCHVAVKAMELGMHVLIEKPLSVSVDDADRMIEAADKAGVIAASVCQRRFFAPCRRVKNAIDEGLLGRPIIGSVNIFGYRSAEYYKTADWRGTWAGEGGGVVVNQAAHQIDLLCWYLGKPKSICAMWDNFTHPTIEVDDTASISVRFESGAIGNLLLTNCVDPALFANVHVYGSNGNAVGVQTDGGEMFIAGMSKISNPALNDLWSVKGQGNMLPVFEREDRALFEKIDATSYYHELQMKDFADALIMEKKPLITAQDARNTVAIMQGVYESARLKKEIDI